ncbi:alpha/beta fold hydrolase, partial [Lacticaseibacillus rhamnosus]
MGGHGPAVVLLHGFAETSRMWTPILPVLGEKFTVIAPDLPGIGDSVGGNRRGFEAEHAPQSQGNRGRNAAQCERTLQRHCAVMGSHGNQPQDTYRQQRQD